MNNEDRVDEIPEVRKEHRRGNWVVNAEMIMRNHCRFLYSADWIDQLDDFDRMLTGRGANGADKITLSRIHDTILAPDSVIVHLRMLADMQQCHLRYTHSQVIALIFVQQHVFGR